MEKTLGSLFDGIAGFPLAGSYSGFTAMWASEIEPFPIRVTKIRFPRMKHLGDITKINGAEIEPTAVIAGGSPCQDLSVAGKRAGMAQKCNQCGKEFDIKDEITHCPVCGAEIEKTRSGLFMEQIRIVKEMREADAKRGRTGQFIRPRFMVWENVPGAFSSHNGEDFRIVLEETCRIVDGSVHISRPSEGWPTVGAIMGKGFSLAWRVLDAQYWGVPQRRRRIFLVADFAGFSAAKILFKSESMPGNSPTCEAPWQGATADAERSAGAASKGIVIPINDKATRCNGGGPTRNEDGAGNGLGIGNPGDPAPTLSCGDRHAVAYGITSQSSNSMKSDNPFSGIYEADVSKTLDTSCADPSCNQGGIAIVSAGFNALAGVDAGSTGFQKELSPTLRAGYPLNVCTYDARGNGDGSTAATLTGDHQNRITDYTSLALTPYYTLDKAAYNSGENSSYGFQVDENLSPTLTSRQPPAAFYPKVAGTLTSKMARGIGGPAGDECQNLISCYFAARRLTPLECERLQGYPDGWTDIPGASDSARYKALGNSVAVPCVAYIMRGIAQELDRIA
jgi:DNA (cytosine-5)-methyltransferase 1